MKRMLRIVLPVALLLFAVFLTKTLVGLRPKVEPTTPEIVPPVVAAVGVESAALDLVVHAQGTVVPRTQSRLVSEVAGRIVEVSPDWVNGGFFEAGELLVAIDPTDYELAEKEAEMRVAQAELSLAQDLADAEIAQRDWEVLNGDTPAPPLVVREPQVREARASLAAAKSALEKAARDLERCRIVAPYPGRIRSKSVDVGEFVQRGSELGRVYAIDRAEIRLPLPDSELEFLDLPLAYRGPRVTEPIGTNGVMQAEGAHWPEVTLSARFAGSAPIWSGRIVRTEGELDPESRMVVAVCEVEDPYGRSEETNRPPLAVGMFVDATIQGIRVPDALAMPRTALRTGDRVFVVEGAPGEERLAIREVEVLRTERDRVLVQSGVTPGERVVLSPIETAVDGMRIRLDQEDSR